MVVFRKGRMFYSLFRYKFLRLAERKIGYSDCAMAMVRLPSNDSLIPPKNGHRYLVLFQFFGVAPKWYGLFCILIFMSDYIVFILLQLVGPNGDLNLSVIVWASTKSAQGWFWVYRRFICFLHFRVRGKYSFWNPCPIASCASINRIVEASYYLQAASAAPRAHVCFWFNDPGIGKFKTSA